MGRTTPAETVEPTTPTVTCTGGGAASPQFASPATSKAFESAWRRSSNETCEQTRPLQFRGADQDASSPMSSLSSVPAASPSKGDALVGSVGLPVDAAVVDRATD